MEAKSVVPELTERKSEVKPLVKHVISKEMQLYFETIKTAILSPDESVCKAALHSLSHDTGLHQLLPYFVQLVSDHVTRHLGNLFILRAMMSTVRALMDNPNLFIDPYVSSSSCTSLRPTDCTFSIAASIDATDIDMSGWKETVG